MEKVQWGWYRLSAGVTLSRGAHLGEQAPTCKNQQRTTRNRILTDWAKFNS